MSKLSLRFLNHVRVTEQSRVLLTRVSVCCKVLFMILYFIWILSISVIFTTIIKYVNLRHSNHRHITLLRFLTMGCGWLLQNKIATGLTGFPQDITSSYFSSDSYNRNMWKWTKLVLHFPRMIFKTRSETFSLAQKVSTGSIYTCDCQNPQSV
jgi:hypothetical protein